MNLWKKSHMITISLFFLKCLFIMAWNSGQFINRNGIYSGNAYRIEWAIKNKLP